MPRTPEEEEEFQQLSHLLNPVPAAPAAPVTPPEGVAKYAGRELINLLPNTFNAVINTAQPLLGVDPKYRADFSWIDQPPSETTGQSAVKIAGGLIAQAPSFIVPELAAIRGLQGLGMASQASKIGGAALGWAVPGAAMDGAETAVGMGATGALQTAAREGVLGGWKGKLFAGVAGGGYGYYEGAKHSPEQAMIGAGLNLLVPTVIDPLLGKLLGHPKTNTAPGTPGPAAPMPPFGRPPGPIPTPGPSPGFGRPPAGPLSPPVPGQRWPEMMPQPMGPRPMGPEPMGPGPMAPVPMGPETMPPVWPGAVPVPEPAPVANLQPLAPWSQAMEGPSTAGAAYGRLDPYDIFGTVPRRGAVPFEMMPQGMAPEIRPMQPNPFSMSPRPMEPMGMRPGPMGIGAASLKIPPIAPIAEASARTATQKELFHNWAKETGTVYQGEMLGGHTFKEETTKSNFFIKEGEEISLEKIHAKAEAMRAEAKAKPKMSEQEADDFLNKLIAEAEAKNAPASAPHPQTKMPSGLLSDLKHASLSWTEPGVPMTKYPSQEAIAFGKTQTSPTQIKRLARGIVVLREARRKLAETATTDADVRKMEELAGKEHFLSEAFNWRKKEQQVVNLQQSAATTAPPRPPLPGTGTPKHIYGPEAGKEIPMPGAKTPLPPHPTEPVKPAAAQPPVANLQPVQVQVLNERGEWHPATVISRTGDTVHVRFEDHLGRTHDKYILANRVKPMSEDPMLMSVEGGGESETATKLKAFNAAADKVLERTAYGQREETAATKSFKLSWSNAHRRWGVVPSPVAKGTTVKLDANEILLAGKTKKEISEIAQFLPELPLDKFSHERMPVMGSLAKESPNAAIFKELGIDPVEFFKKPDKGAALDRYMDYLRQEFRGSRVAGAGPSLGSGKASGAMHVETALAQLPKEAADILRQVIGSWAAASGQKLALHFSDTLGAGVAGAAYEMSGRIALQWQRVKNVFNRWESLSVDKRGAAVTRFVALLGHEMTHIAQQYGERTGLLVDGVPLVKAITDATFSIPLEMRMKIAGRLKLAKGEPGEVINAYLAGDAKVVGDAYRRGGRVMDDAKAMEFAAGEFMAEIGAVELARRARIEWLPSPLRKVVDTFKRAIVETVAWLKGEKSEVANLQRLSKIAERTWDHFSEAERASLGKAFPSSELWNDLIPTSRFPSVRPPVPVIPRGPVAVTEHPSQFLQGELLRLGVRGAVGAVAGGTLAPRMSDNQISTAEGVILGGLLGTAGVAMAKHMLKTDVVKQATAAVVNKTGNPLKAVRALFGGEGSIALGQEAALHGKFASVLARLVRVMEQEFKVNLDAKTAGIIEHGKGIPQEQFMIMHEAFLQGQRFKPNDSLLAATGDFYEGRLSRQAFEALLTTAEEKHYGNFVKTARDAQSTLSEIIARALPASGLRTHMLRAVDTYLGRFYSAYREGKFNENAFAKAKADFMKAYPQFSADTAEAYMREHQQEILANRKMFRTRTGGSEKALDSAVFKRRLATEEEIAAQQGVVAGLEHDTASAEYLAAKAKLDWMEEHQITDGWREWLGEYRNPNERMMMTFMKAYPSSIAAKVISYFADLETTLGLKYAYTATEHSATISKLKADIAKVATDGPEVANLQLQLDELRSYMPLGNSAVYGRLAGKYVGRFVRDEMANYSNPFQWMDQPIIRGLAAFNSMVKISRTALNPLTTIRNYFQLPAFMLISGATPSHIGQAWGVLKKGADKEMLSIMRQRHIVGVDFAAVELAKGPGEYFNGMFDADVATRAGKMALHKMLKIYQVPDVLIRAGTFLHAIEKFAAEAKMTVAQARKNTDILDRATDFTERYTMNYSAVPRVVRIARQLPFVSLFISYASEITRILKNLTMDVISPVANGHSRLRAATVLGGMAAVPAMLTVAAKEALTPEERAEWEMVERNSPDYLRSRFRLPLGREADGRWRFIDVTNMLPADNISQMVKAALTGDFEAARKANPIFSLQDTPLLNIASEQIQGRDIHTGQEISGVVARAKQVVKEIVPPIIPPGFEGQRIARALTPNAEGTFGLTNLRTGVDTRPSDILLNYLTAMRFGNVNADAVRRQSVAAAQREIANLQAAARQVLNTNASDEAKQETAEHLQRMTQEVLLALAQKLG